MPSWARSLQFRLTLGFTLILAGALLSVSAFAYAATDRKIDSFSDEVAQARAERLDSLVSDSYQRFGGWDGVQEALEQVSRLYDWRVIIEDSGGLIVGDSYAQFERQPAFSSYFVRRPVMVGGQRLGTFFIEARGGFVKPPKNLADFGSAALPGGSLFGTEGLSRTGRPGAVQPADGAEESGEHSGRPRSRPDQPSSRTQVVVAAEPPLSELASSFNRSLLWSGLTAATAGIALVAFTTRRALRPVRELSEAASGVAAGDLSQRVDARAGSEIGNLGVAFNEMASTLEDSEVERRRMVADIAHELRSPLTNIQGYLEAIKDGVLEPDERTIDTIYDQTKHLGALVEDLRLLALVEAGSLRLELAGADLPALVSDATEAFRPRALERSITLQIDDDHGLPPVTLDTTRIRQVVSNLVENAITHTPDGGGVTVTVGPAGKASGGNLARITVADTGAGIPAEELPHVFDRFYRVDPSRNRATGGAGLGLTIVKRLAELHGGNVSAASDAGRGSTFTVELPFAGPQADGTVSNA